MSPSRPPARIDGALEPLALDYVRLAREAEAVMALEDATRALPHDRSSTSHALVRRASCPVVVVPVPGEHHDRR